MTRFHALLTGNSQGTTACQLSNLQSMQPPQIVSQTDDGPFTAGSGLTTHKELAEAQHLLDEVIMGSTVDDVLRESARGPGVTSARVPAGG